MSLISELDVSAVNTDTSCVSLDERKHEQTNPECSILSREFDALPRSSLQATRETLKEKQGNAIDAESSNAHGKQQLSV